MTTGAPDAGSASTVAATPKTSSITATIAGGYGVTARVLPRHADLASPHDLGLVAWA